MGEVTRERKWGLTLFGLPFFGVGVGFLILSVIPTLFEAQQMTAWPSTQGTLSSARLTSSTSDGSTTYGVEARYSYRVNGMSYSNDRVAINSGSDNIGSFQLDLGRRLEHHYRTEQPVTVYYNPTNPAEAVLDRTLRWGLLGFKLIFVLLFGGAGLGMILLGLRGKRLNDTPDAIEKSWMRNPDWADNRISSGARGGLYFAWGFAIFWNLISTPALFGFFAVKDREGALAYLILLFPAIGVLLLAWAIRSTLAWRKFGYTPLTLDPFPGAIGGDVGGEIFVNIPYDPKLACEVTLSSLHSYISGSGKNRSRRESVEWQDSGYTRVERAAKGIRLVFRFAVPEDRRESEEHSDSYYLWRVNIKSEMPGADLDRSFEIPVYATGEKSRRIKVDSTHEVPLGETKPSAEALLPLRQSGMTTELYYPMLRYFGASLLGVIFGGIFAGAGVFLLDKSLFMGIVFSAVGGIIVLGALYSALNALRIELNGRTITTTRSLLGIPIITKQAAYHEVRSVEIKSGMTTQQGGRHRISYKVVAHTRHGELLLAEQLDSHSKANLVATFFMEKLRVEKKEKDLKSEFVVEVE